MSYKILQERQNTQSTMSTIKVIQFASPSSATLDKAKQAFEDATNKDKIVLGVLVQDNNIVQITSEITNASHATAVDRSLTVMGEPSRHFHVSLSQPAFGNNGPLTANVVEYVENYFPASRVTPDFQKQIETDFLRFDSIYRDCAEGATDFAFGWVDEEQKHADLKDEKAKVFFIARGWRDMYSFQRTLEQKAYKEAIPILFLWGVPFNMVSITAF